MLSTIVLPTFRQQWVILRTSIEERLVYRGDFMLGTLLRFLPIVTQIFLWGAIYGVGTSHGHRGYAPTASGGIA